MLLADCGEPRLVKGGIISDPLFVYTGLKCNLQQSVWPPNGDLIGNTALGQTC